MTPRIAAALKARIGRAVRSDKGAVAPMLGILMFVLIGCMGLAIDVGRSVLVKARLVDALDAAGLAVGARLSTSDFNADALKFVKANFKAGYAAATVTSVTASPSADKSVITLSATVTMPTAFMRLFGTSTVTVNATSEVTRASTGLELAIVLDTTGSMDDSGSMPGLMTAAHALVNDLFAGKDTADDLFIGLVPFSQAVNIGTSAISKSWVVATTLTTAVNAGYPSRWTGCVEERKNGLDQTDAPPLIVGSNLSAQFRAYYAPDSWKDADDPYNHYSNNNWIRNNKAYIDYSSRFKQLGPAQNCPPTPITPMTNVKKTVNDDIDKLVAVGGTHINVGAIWGWRMLSPQWRGYWGGTMAAHKLPLNYGADRMTKAMVLMTDGQNTTYEKFYTAYGKLSANNLGTTDPDDAADELDKRLEKVCTDMKAKGILIYTVAYGSDVGGSKALLQRCASKIDFAFSAADTKQLLSKFKLIAGSLSNLRVSK